MKNVLTRIKQLRPATLIAMLALFVAIGGTATAASNLINGKNIKPGTVTAKQLKNKTITKGKLAPATVKALKGAQGATGQRGPQGEPGTPGTPGTPGANGVVNPIEVTLGGHSIAASENRNLLFFDVPAGKYLVTAKVTLESNGNDNMGCKLYGGSGTTEIDQTDATSPEAGTMANIASQGIAPGGTTKIRFSCTTGSVTGSGNDVSVIATPIG